MNTLKDKICQGPDTRKSTAAISASDFRWNVSRRDYHRMVNQALEYINAGDIYQVNLSRRLCCRTNADDFELYTHLLKANPSDFAALLEYPGMSVISTSPERFVECRNRRISTRPIKGTIRRSFDHAEDIKLKQRLLESEKDNAELAMIVDLLRNDLGRISEKGTVKVNEASVVETYQSVHHLVSTIESRLSLDADATDLLRAVFPGGSITGAPKIRAAEIIDELEPASRGVYTGSIGYIDFSGNLDTNIVIRTCIKTGQNLCLDVGGGIVADSDPEAEFAETEHKASAIVKAIGAVK